MKLEYKVLWIDDNLGRLKTVQRHFSGINQDVGIAVLFEEINAKPGPKEELVDFTRRMTSEVTEKFDDDNYYDLILVDLHFGLKDSAGNELFNGSNLIEIIRDKKHTLYRPIIFYSSGEPETQKNAITQLEKAAKESGLFGKSIFTIEWDKLELFMAEIAKDMHKEEHKINHVRGLLMDQVSELDAQIIQIIAKDSLWNSLTEENHKKKVVDKFKKSLTGQLAKLKKAEEDTTEFGYYDIKPYILANPRSINTMTKSKVLREILRHMNDFQDQGDILSQAIKNDDNSITNVRNIYGHETATSLKKSHNNEKCKFIREECRRQLDNIQKVAKI